MAKVLPILKTLGTVLQTIALITVFVMNSLLGYVMLAPDDLPKPFYLSYAGAVPAVPSGLGGTEYVGGSASSGDSHGSDSHSSEDGPTIVRIYEPGEGYMVDTGTKVVNLADPGGRRFLRATVVIELPPLEDMDLPTATGTTEKPAAAGGGGEEAGPSEEELRLEAFNALMQKRLPIINDVINTLLTSKTFEEIYTVEGKEALRAEIRTELNRRIPDLGVIAVYFTEFVVQ